MSLSSLPAVVGFHTVEGAQVLETTEESVASPLQWGTVGAAIWDCWPRFGFVPTWKHPFQVN